MKPIAGLMLAVLLAPSALFAQAPRTTLSTNLSPLDDWGTELPFTDLFRTSRRWFSGTNGTWSDGRTLDVDADGWVRSLQPGQLARTLMAWDISPRYPSGLYTVLYEGEGTLAYTANCQVVESGPGRQVVQVNSASGGIGLYLTATNPQNHLRNIRFLMPGFDGRELFNPVFVERLRGYRVLRFMQWMLGHSQHVQVRAWAERPTLQSARWSVPGTQPGPGGAPLEVMIDLANRLHADPWFTLSHLADDDYVRRFGEMVRDRLDPSLRAYVEHSNEVWNGNYPQAAYAQAQGLALGLSTNPFEAQIRYHARRSRQIFGILEEVLPPTRLVRVLGSQTAQGAWVTQTGLGYADTAAHVDLVAIAPYFGIRPEEQAMARGLTVDQLLTHLETVTIPQVMAAVQLHQAAVSARGVRLAAYEGGQHLVALPPYQTDATLNALYDAANRAPRMGEIYGSYLQQWSAATAGAPFAHFTHCGRMDVYGRFGSLEYEDQPRAAAPKYDALRRWLEAARLEATPATLAPGQAVSVSLRDGTGHPRDWIGLFAAGAADGAWLDWRYLDGSQTPLPDGRTEAVVSFTPPTPGTFEFRFFWADSTLRLATSASVVVAAASGPLLQASASSLSFGTVGAGSRLERDLTLTNAGSGTLQGAGTTAAPFRVVAGGSYALGAGESSTLRVAFEPAAPGAFGGSLALSGGGGLSVALSGTASASPTVTASASSAGPGAVVSALVSQGPAGPTDWIGLYAAGAPDGSFLAWRYLNGLLSPPPLGLASAEVPFTLPSAAGSYEFRLFASNGYTRLAVSAPVTVLPASLALVNGTVAAGQPAAVTVANGPASPRDWVGLYAAGAPDREYRAWSYLNGSATPPPAGLSTATLTFTAPALGGLYEFRLFANDGFTRLATSPALSVQGPAPAVAASTAAAAPGQTVSALVTGGPGARTDWVGLYASGAADTGLLAWAYLNGLQAAPASGLSSASVPFTMPGAGSYEFRFFASDGFVRLARSAAIVVGGGATVFLGTATAAPGQTVQATVSGGPANRTDWIGLFAVGAPNGSFLAWSYLNGQHTAPVAGLSSAVVPVALPLAPGTYEVRLFADDGFTRLASSASVSVQ